ncbi:MAG: insulinase family protein [Acidobacteria bacterium]|nr:insulinase family protein [Acidobacteriota bacterium]
MRQPSMKLARIVPVLLLALPHGAPAAEVPLPKDLPPFGAERTLPPPVIAKSVTPEGLTVWILKRPGLPKITATLAVRGGSAADAAGLEGTSEILAEVLRAGTKTRSAQKIAEELQAVGGQLGANATDDATTLTVDGLANGTTTLLTVLADVARNAAYPDTEVALAKANSIEGLKARESTPEFLAERAFGKALFGSHPYAVVAPMEEAVGRVTADGLRKEHARRFRPDRALLVVAGDLDPAAVSATIQKVFAGWKATGEAPAATPEANAASNAQLVVVNRPGSVQSLIMMGRQSPKATDPDFYATSLANTIFGGGFSSRLVQNIREGKGYTYSPGASVTTYEKGGNLRVRADVRNDVTGAALLEMFYELDRMATTSPTDRELADAKRYRAGLYLLNNQVQGAVVGSLVNNWIKGLPPEELGLFVTKISAVTADQVRAAGKKYFTSRTQSIVIVGDEARVKEEIAPFRLQ